jgi:hypothetical protein
MNDPLLSMRALIAGGLSIDVSVAQQRQLQRDAGIQRHRQCASDRRRLRHLHAHVHANLFFGGGQHHGCAA